MNGFSTVDGFVEITESLAEMIKYVANEPSMGLFYVQQHTRNAVPNVVNLNNHVVEKSREATLHTEDLEDSITVVRSMKECGFPIADEMIKDIRNSLTLMSAKQPKRGLIHSSASSFQMRRTSSWGPMSWGHGSGNVQQDGSNYFSTVIKSAKQKARNFKWPQLESMEEIQAEPQKPLPHPTPPLSVAPASTRSIPDTEADELTLSSQMADEPHEEEEEKVETEDDAKLSHHNLSFMSENYGDFKADKEAKLEQWLEGTEGKMDKSKGESDAGGLRGEASLVLLALNGLPSSRYSSSPLCRTWRLFWSFRSGRVFMIPWKISSSSNHGASATPGSPMIVLLDLPASSAMPKKADYAMLIRYSKLAKSLSQSATQGCFQETQ